MNYLYLFLSFFIAILAYFDVKNKNTIPNDLMHSFILFALIASVVSVFQPNFNPTILTFVAIILGVLSFALYVMNIWGLADVMVVCAIALVAPELGFLALLFAIIAYCLVRSPDWLKQFFLKKREEVAVPFIPFLLAGFVLAWVLPSLPSLLALGGFSF